MKTNLDEKSLVEVFRELEETKNRQIEMYKKNKENSNNPNLINNKVQKETYQSYSFISHLKKDKIKLMLIVLVMSLIVSLFSSNYIFAKDLSDEKEPVGVFEENENVTDIYEIVSENISTSYQKEILDIEEEIEFETEYIENKDLPKDEEVVEQEGVLGHQIVTYVRSYENNEITDEQAIGYNILEEPVTQIIQVGTSEVLKNYNIHIGDYLYTLKDLEIKKEANDESESLVSVPNKYDVQTLEVVDETWMKVKYVDKEGYINIEDLTSETLTPGSAEACRKQKIFNSVNSEMELNKPSGLLEKDFEKVFKSNPKDTNNVFKENYQVFSKIETKYNINGVFVAAIAIHESNWGKSAIAIDKKNLFGFGAYDATPYESAVTFETYEEGINTVSLWLVKNYLNESGTLLQNGETASGRFYNGPTVSGVNIRYATDTNWSTRVFEIMQDIYNSI